MSRSTAGSCLGATRRRVRVRRRLDRVCAFFQPRATEVVNRLQHPEAQVAVLSVLFAEQRAVEQRLSPRARPVALRIADRFDRLQRAAAGEDGEPA